MLPLSALLSKTAGVWIVICVVFITFVFTLVICIRKSNRKPCKVKVRGFISPMAGYLPADRRKGHYYSEEVSYDVVVLITPLLSWGKLRLTFDDSQCFEIRGTSCEILSEESDPLWEEFLEVNFDKEKSVVKVSVQKYFNFVLGIGFLDWIEEWSTSPYDYLRENY